MVAWREGAHSLLLRFSCFTCQNLHCVAKTSEFRWKSTSLCNLKAKLIIKGPIHCSRNGSAGAHQEESTKRHHFVCGMFSCFFSQGLTVFEQLFRINPMVPEIQTEHSLMSCRIFLTSIINGKSNSRWVKGEGSRAAFLCENSGSDLKLSENKMGNKLLSNNHSV